MRRSPITLETVVPTSGFVAAAIILLAFGLGGCGRASAQTDAAVVATESLGTGAIAEECQREFTDPMAQTACEVHMRMEIDSGTERRLETLNGSVSYLYGIVERQNKRIEALEAELASRK